MSRCGSCTMCCRLTAVPELKKPLWEWCQFCDVGEGCRVYDVRPTSCQKFECYWYKHEELPLSLRPDNCRIVFEILGERKIVLALVSPHQQLNIFRRPDVHRFVQNLMDTGWAIALVADRGATKRLFVPKGRSATEIKAEIEGFAIENRVIPDGGTILYDRPEHGDASGGVGDTADRLG